MVYLYDYFQLFAKREIKTKQKNLHLHQTIITHNNDFTK